MTTVGEVAALIEEWAPKELAAEWDNVGLQLGEPAQRVDTVVAALDVDREALDLARKEEADLIVAHHPLLFRPLQSLNWTDERAVLIRELIRANISVYVAHTNLDVAPGGTSAVLAERLGLDSVEVLSAAGAETLYKFVVFVPEEAADGLRFALGEAGAGWTGGYSHCSFRTTGEGTFLPREGTSPYIGEQGELTEVAEHRLETIVTSDRLPAVLEAVKKNHPYEEPAYDIYRLENQGEAWGFGRIGELECAVTLAAFARSVEAALDSEVEVLGCLEESVQRVAVCGGAGADFIDSAISQGAAVYVTGDVKYHEAQEAQAAGLALIDGGHAATEAPVVEALAEYLREQLPADCTIAAHPHSTVKWKGVE